MLNKEEIKIFLASSSPRRKELLKRVFKNFYIIENSPIEEDLTSTSLEKLVLTNALKKAEIAEKEIKFIPSLIIAADTIVSIDGKALGKPTSKEEAICFLRKLSGKTHNVFSGVAIILKTHLKNEIFSFTERTKVTFNELPIIQIKSYVEKYSPLDKAGAYGIQEIPSNFVKSIEGEYENIVGLPLRKLIELLIKLQKLHHKINFENVLSPSLHLTNFCNS